MIDVVALSPLWEKLPQAESLCHKVFALLLAKKYVESDEEIALALSDNAHLQQLNAQFRQIDKPTNVLSFENDTEPCLGDIAIAYETIAQEAHEQDKSIEDHFTHITLHGILHLLGFDHINEKDAIEMENLETSLLHELNIANPYEEITV
jgi:probable rRNA maturation factor